MSRGALTTTSYALLGLLSLRPWSTYELTQQMDRSLGRMWPRAQSKLYEEPKKLVAHGLATTWTESVGHRRRTLYSITDAGRAALADWLGTPGAGPALEFEGLLKVFFADAGTTEDLRATLTRVRGWAAERAAESHAIGEQYLAGHGPFPDRLPVQQLTVRFLNDFYALVAEWATWAEAAIEEWPARPADAEPDLAVIRESLRRAAEVMDRRSS